MKSRIKNVNPSDIRISLTQADHQVNLGNWNCDTPAGVILFHEPTGTFVEVTRHKSYHKNKAEALERLNTILNKPTSLEEELTGRGLLRFMVSKGCGSWNFHVVDSESFYEPVAGFFGEQEAIDYATYLNRRNDGI